MVDHIDEGSGPSMPFREPQPATTWLSGSSLSLALFHRERKMGSSIIEDFYSILLGYVRKFGWYFVFLMIALYNVLPYIEEFRRKRALAHAKDPKRVSLLNDQRDEIRRQQQKKFKTSASQR